MNDVIAAMTGEKPMGGDSNRKLEYKDRVIMRPAIPPSEVR